MINSVGSGSSAAAAQAAAAARARAEAEARARAEAARKAAEAARKAAQKAQETARKAQQAAAQKQKAASEARSHLQAAKAAQEKNKDPAKKAALAAKVKSASGTYEKSQDAASTAAAKAKGAVKSANTAADKALRAEQQANTLATQAGMKPPFSEANQVQDVFSAKALSAADQTKLFGGQLAVSAKDAAKVDAQRLSATQDPVARAKLLQTFMKGGSDPAYQTAFVQDAKPQLQQLSQQIWNDKSGFSTDERRSALETLTRTTESMAPEAQKALATEFAQTLPNKGIGSDGNNLGGLLARGIKDGAGASFGVQLASALQASGKTNAANDVAKYVNQGISQIRQQFEAASKTMDEKNALLSKALSFNKDLTPAQAARLAQDVKNKIGYGSAQKAFEAASAKLGTVLNGAGLASSDPNINACRIGGQNEEQLAGTGQAVLNDIPKLATSKAGGNAIADAVVASGEGKPTFLDQIKEVGHFGGEAIKNIKQAIITSLGARALSMAQDQNFSKDSKSLFNGVAKLSKLFGCSDEQMRKFTGILSTFRPDMSPQKMKGLTKVLDDQIGEMSDGNPKSSIGIGLKSLGAVFAVASAYQGLRQFGSENFTEKVQTINSTLGAANGVADALFSATSKFAGNLASEAASTAGAIADAGSNLLKSLDPAMQLVGAVTSVVTGVDEINHGQYVQAAGDFVTAGGNLVAGLTEGVPVVDLAGQAVGDGLAVLGQGIKLVANLFSSPPDPFAGTKDGLKQGFQQIGLNDNLASKLSELHGKNDSTFGSYIQQVAGQAGVKPSQLLTSMNHWSDQQVAQFLDVARLSFDTDGRNGNRLANASSVIGPVARYLENGQRLQHTGADGQPVYNSGVVDRVAQWVVDNGLVPPPPTLNIGGRRVTA